VPLYEAVRIETGASSYPGSRPGGLRAPLIAGALRHHKLRGGPPSTGGTPRARGPVAVCLRAATVAAKVLQQSALGARSHARAHVGRAGAGRTSASHRQVKPGSAGGRAKQGAIGTS